jgi:hypothetical protein
MFEHKKQHALNQITNYKVRLNLMQKNQKQKWFLREQISFRLIGMINAKFLTV